MRKLDGKRLLFIGGMARSGTTWTQLMLGGHPDVAMGRETHVFARYVKPMLARHRAETSQKAYDGVWKYFDEDRFLDALVAPFVTTVLEGILARNPGAEVVMDKTPSNIHHVRLIHRLFGEQAYFLHVIRDPRAVFASHKAAATEDWGGWAQKTASQAGKLWRNIQARRPAMQNCFGPRYRELRYECLHAAPEQEMGGLFEWLGLDSEPAQRAKIAAARDLAHLHDRQEIRDAANPADEPRPNFFRKGQPEGWRKELTAKEIRDIEAAAGDAMRALGYMTGAGA